MAGPSLQSQWLEGSIRHRRLAPVQHQFRYNTGMLALDLSEWDVVPKLSRWFSSEGFNWLSLKRQDYLPGLEGSLDQAVRRQVADATGWTPDGPIELITHPRYLGHGFNPVSFYFCYHQGDNPAAGATPRVILAEITNTPWHNRHIYCLEGTSPATTRSGWTTLKFGFDKRFHVSPFNPMAQHYRWVFSFRGPELRIHMTVLDAGAGEENRKFDATLVVRRTPLTRKTINRSLRQFPLESIKVVAGIYWHALRLKLKGARFHGHPDTLASGEAGYRQGSEDRGLDVTRPDNKTQSGGKVSSWRI